MPASVRLAPWILLGAAVVGAVLLRLPTLGEQSYWYDELATLNVTSVGFPSLLDALSASEATPPAYYFVAKAWRELLGDGETVLRLLSALSGIATVPVVYAAARSGGGTRAGVIAAALVAVNPLMVWFSQEARAYALLALLSALTFLFFVRALDDRRQRWIWAWAIAGALALATHYFAFTIIVPEGIWLYVMLRRSRAKVVLAGGGVLATAAALGPLALAQQNRTSWIESIDIVQRLLQVPQHFVVGLQSPSQALAALAVVSLAAVLIYLLAGADRPTRRTATRAGAMALGGFLLALAAAALGRDFLITRNLIALWPPFAVGVGVVLGAPRSGRVGLSAAAVLAALGVAISIWTALTPAAQRPDWRVLAQALEGPAGSRLILGRAVGGDMLPLTLYLAGTQPAPPGTRVRAAEVVVIALRPTPDYGIGPCWWGVFCGGEFDSELPIDFLLEVSRPPDLPPGLRLLERGKTERLLYRRYAAPGDTLLPPSSFFHPQLIQSPPPSAGG